MKLFVVGLHRGGTHAYAKHLAQKNHIPFIEEGMIEWNDLEAAKLLVKGKVKKYDIKTNKYIILKNKQISNFVLQCPGLSHKAIELSKIGKVYWITRNYLDTVTAMKNAGINEMAWDIMKDFKNEWPNDPIWKYLKYDGKNDHYCNFVGYYTLLIKLKEYIYYKYLKSYAQQIFTENQIYYDRKSTLTEKKPLKPRELDMVKKHLKLWEVAKNALLHLDS